MSPAPGPTAQAIGPAALLSLLLPVPVGLSLSIGMAKALHTDLSPAPTLLFLLGIFATYTLDTTADFRRIGQLRWQKALRLLAFISMAGLLLGGLLLPTTRLPLLGLGLISLGYRRLKRRLPKDPFLAPAWCYAIGSLSLQGQTWASEDLWGWLALLILLQTNFLLCDLLDYAEDARNGVRNLCVWLGPQRSRALALLLSLLAAALFAHMGQWAFALVALACLGLALRPLPGQRLFLDGLLLLPGLCAIALP